MMDFIKHGELERGLTVRPGHEYLVVGRSNYGISDDDWVFVVRSATCVAMLSVSSRALNGRLLETAEERRVWHEDYARKYGYMPEPPYALHAGIVFCTSFPTDVEAIRQASRGNECVLQQSGRHFEYTNSALQANGLVMPLDDLFMSGPPPWWTASHDEVKRQCIEQAEVWTRLTAWFRTQDESARTAHAALPQRCTHCDGAGVVPKGTLP